MRKERSCVGRTLLMLMAGIAAVRFAKEVPAMVRYFKMKRL
jgi:hypothetical protein